MSGGRAPRDRGARAERAVAAYLRERIWPRAERRQQGAPDDTGDMTGIPLPVIIDVKDHETIKLAAFIDQLLAEQERAGARHGVVFVKRRRRTDPAEWYAVTTVEQYLDLCERAGLGSEVSP